MWTKIDKNNLILSTIGQVLFFFRVDIVISFFFFLPHCFIIIILLYNIVLALPYINMHPPRVYTCSPS